MRGPAQTFRNLKIGRRLATGMTTEELIERAAARAAELAVELYASRHPRPAHVTLAQAAEMLGVERHTVSRYVRQGILKRNAMGQVPVEQIDAAIRAVAH